VEEELRLPASLSFGREAAEARERAGELIADDVRVWFGDKEVLHGVSVGARRGEVLGLIGPSGCGKTTFLRTLNRLTELSPGARIEGKVTLDGGDIYDRGLDVNRLRRRIGMVFQQPNPFPMTVFDNVAYVLRDQARRRPGRAALADPVESALRRAGLWDEVKDGLDGSALRLSGGQQQRLCIARALAADPEVLLMDEPCSALDPRSTAVVEELIMALRQDLAVVVVTHNLGQAHRISDRVAFLLMGDLIEVGPTDVVFADAEQEETREYVAGVFG
jgi:phosphate transport system ATP-binding protein